MPKQKTHKGLSKRVKVTGSGKVKYKKAFTGHLMSSKSSKRKRSLSKAGMMTATMAKKVKSFLCN